MSDEAVAQVRDGTSSSSLRLSPKSDALIHACIQKPDAVAESQKFVGDSTTFQASMVFTKVDPLVKHCVLRKAAGLLALFPGTQAGNTIPDGNQFPNKSDVRLASASQGYSSVLIRPPRDRKYLEHNLGDHYIVSLKSIVIGG